MMLRSTTTAPPPDAITEEAIAWFVRTHSDQRTLADEDRFAQWLKQDPRHARVYARIEEVWRSAGPEITPRALVSDVDVSPNDGRRARRAAWALTGIAAALGMLAVGAMYLHNVGGGRLSEGTYATPAGAQRELKLADGSTIRLNTRSEISVGLGEHERSVRLVRGEARFEVAKDATRPFIVDAGAARVRAIGTAFDVRVSDTRVAVTLVEGRVEVTPTGASIKLAAPALLSAGEKLSVDVSSGERRIESVNLERASAWLQQQLIFDSVPLHAAVDEANRYLPLPITIEDPTLADIRISGVVRAGNVASFVGSLESSFPVEAIARDGGRIALVRRSDAHSR
jgi:transmembrane sensor